MQLKKCLSHVIEDFVVYKADGQVDHVLSDFERIEEIGIDYLNFTKELQIMVDQRLQEVHVTGGVIEKAGIENLEEGKMNALISKDARIK